MKMDRVLSLLGLAKKAGKVRDGSFAVEESVKKGKAILVVVAHDVSGSSGKKLKDMCRFYGVSLLFYATKESLGAALGKEYRAAAAVEDQGFADLIKVAVQKSRDTDGTTLGRQEE